MNGVLAIWNDCKAGREECYEDWYQTEHLPERLAVPGFQSGRRYEALDGTPRFLTIYEVDEPGVLTTSAYLERLENPTPKTARIMADGFENMSRTVCVVTKRVGSYRGAVAVTVSLSDPTGVSVLSGFLDRLTVGVEPVHAEVWLSADDGGAAFAKEEQLRGGDRKIAACLLIEFLRETEALELAGRVGTEIPDGAVGTYRLMCELRKRDG